MKHTIKTDVIIIGAGAAGLMCGIEAGKRKRKVMVLDHANKPGKKILMSGGGRCNFTNYYIDDTKYLSNNPHFIKSALRRYTQWDFIELVKQHHIPFHEKAHGQLFCDNKAKDILEMLLGLCDAQSVEIKLNTNIQRIEHLNLNHYLIHTENYKIHCESLVIASGGLSIPTMGASAFGYQVAEQFDLKVLPTRAGLVPLTLYPEDKCKFSTLTGVAVNSVTRHRSAAFEENILFTHRGLSGPAILQISSYWQGGDLIDINLLPDQNLFTSLQEAQKNMPEQQVKTLLSKYLPKSVVTTFIDEAMCFRALKTLTNVDMQNLVKQVQAWQIKPSGTEGYRTAEVTIGGVDCQQISSKTMEVLNRAGLYFIGEVLDVTGWLGGYNFQWAWSSGWAAGQVV